MLNWLRNIFDCIVVVGQDKVKLILGLLVGADPCPFSLFFLVEKSVHYPQFGVNYKFY